MTYRDLQELSGPTSHNRLRGLIRLTFQIPDHAETTLVAYGLVADFQGFAGRGLVALVVIWWPE